MYTYEVLCFCESKLDQYVVIKIVNFEASPLRIVNIQNADLGDYGLCDERKYK